MTLGWGAASAQVVESEAMIRKRQEAERPMRWIIENAKIERKAPIADAEKKTKAPATVAAKPKAKPRTETTADVAVVPPPAAERTVPVERWTPPTATITRTPVPSATAAPLARATLPVTQPIVNDLAPVETAASSIDAKVSADQPSVMDDDPLLPVSQDPPQVWSGLCDSDCNQFVFRVAFTVLPNGKVSKVRLLEGGRPRFNGTIVQAVSRWTYQPISKEREEEVLIRLGH